jgi:hypothetical protein
MLTKTYNADFDGDEMNMHVPHTMKPFKKYCPSNRKSQNEAVNPIASNKNPLSDFFGWCKQVKHSKTSQSQ